MSYVFRLSLSTTFGGSPVVAHSPFCLLVANVNTLVAQFLFVFLSGGGKQFTLHSQLGYVREGLCSDLFSLVMYPCVN